MKKIFALTVLLFAIIPTSTFADSTPQKVVSIVKRIESYAWYAEQVVLWKKELEKDNTNGDAWLNYYTAARMANITKQQGNVIQAAHLQSLEELVEEMGKAIPNSFEFHYTTYWNGGNDEKLFHHIEKAYAIDPNRAELYDEFVTHYALINDEPNRKVFSEKWFNSNDISASVMAWNYNLLMSTEENAILLTGADNDTYPSFILQDAQHVREDVQVMNLYMIGNKKYRQALFEQLGLPAFNKKNTDFSSGAQYQNALTQHIIDHAKVPVYFAASAPKSVLQYHQSNLYLVGLAFRYSTNRFDNTAVLKKNYERKFLKDNLKVQLFNDESESVDRHMQTYYLMPLLKLRAHYEESEEKQKLEELDVIIKKVAEASRKEEEIKSYLDLASENAVMKPMVDISVKDIIGNMQKVGKHLFANAIETPNEAYELFLMDLLKRKDFDALAKCKIHDVDWRKQLPAQYQNLSDEDLFKHGEPNRKDMPVVNITHEAAMEYCKWLTQTYNSFPEKKRKYKEVIFRLPTEEEWTAAAYSGVQELRAKSAPEGAADVNKTVLYPWGNFVESFDRDQITNPAGCYLANIQTWPAAAPSTCADCSAQDGAAFVVNPTSYMPNDFGLYCTVGNVAEMTIRNGIAKGGSWGHSIEESVIPGHQSYDGQDPRVGFRVFMEVVEY